MSQPVWRPLLCPACHRSHFDIDIAALKEGPPAHTAIRCTSPEVGSLPTGLALLACPACVAPLAKIEMIPVLEGQIAIRSTYFVEDPA